MASTVWTLADFGIDENEQIAGLPTGDEIESLRREYCGKPYGQSLPIKIGRFVPFVIYCRNYANCPICGARRKDDVSRCVLNCYKLCIAGSVDLCARVVDADEASAVRKFFGRDKVFVVPQVNGQFVAFIHGDAARGTVYERYPVVSVDKDRIMYLTDDLDAVVLDIATIARDIPTGRSAARMFGSLGGRVRRDKASTKDDDGETWPIKVYQFVIADADEKLIAVAFKKANKALGPADTSSAKALQASYNARMYFVRSFLMRNGIDMPTLQVITQRVKPEDVKW